MIRLSSFHASSFIDAYADNNPVQVLISAILLFYDISLSRFSRIIGKPRSRVRGWYDGKSIPLPLDFEPLHSFCIEHPEPNVRFQLLSFYDDAVAYSMSFLENDLGGFYHV